VCFCIVSVYVTSLSVGSILSFSKLYIAANVEETRCCLLIFFFINVVLPHTMVKLSCIIALLYITDHCKHRHLERYRILRTATSSQSVLIPCDVKTNLIEWRYCRDESSEGYHITNNGLIGSDLKEKYKLLPNGLRITDIQPSDAGSYICRDKYSRQTRITRLSVPCK